MEFLKTLLGEHYDAFVKMINEHNGNPENKDKQIKLANLSSGEYVSKAKFDSLDAEKVNINQQLTDANALIEQLKASSKGNEDLQTKIGEYEGKVKNLETELAETKINSAIKVGLLEEHAVDVDYLTYKLKEKNETLELDEQGHIKGWDDKLSALKTQLPNMFKSEGEGSGFDGYDPIGKGSNKHDNNEEPKNLAEALKLQFEESNNN